MSLQQTQHAEDSISGVEVLPHAMHMPEIVERRHGKHQTVISLNMVITSQPRHLNRRTANLNKPNTLIDRIERAARFAKWPAIGFAGVGCTHIWTYAIQNIAHIHAAMSMGVTP